MLTWAVAVLCLTSSVLAHDGPVDYTGYKVITARFQTEEQAQFIKNLADENVVYLWNEPNQNVGYTMIQIPPGLAEAIETVLTKEGITFETAFEDLQDAILKERRDNRPAQSEYAMQQSRVNSFALNRYHTLAEINTFLEDVVREYPRLAERITIGTTYENRTIQGLRISAAAKGTRPAIFLEFGIHAREWISPATALYIIKELTAGSKNDTVATRLLSNYEFYIIPSANPDGYVYTHTTNRAWRKTRSRSRVSPGCIGADANRNFDINFCGAGSSRLPCSETYCGDFAFSEKESQALKSFTQNLGPRLKIYVAVHSYSQLWMYPYGYTYNYPPNYQQLDVVAKAGVDALRAVSGTVYKYGPIATTIYQASGSSIDWVYDTVGCKMSFALELRDKGLYGFILPPSQIIPTAKETWAGLKAAVQAVR